MRDRAVARRYAQALFELGREQRTLDALEGELRSVLEVVAENAELKATLEHPRVPKQQKFQVLDDVFADRVSKQVLNLLRLLVEKQRERYLQAIYDEFRRFCDQERGIVEARVTVAAQLPGETLEQIRKALSGAVGRQLRLQVEVDPELIGGLVVQVGDRRIDASLRRRLQALRRHIAAGGESVEVSAT